MVEKFDGISPGQYHEGPKTTVLDNTGSPGLPNRRDRILDVFLAEIKKETTREVAC